MEDRELKALIALLDDDDPVVMEEVWSRLTSLGQSGVERLEAEWEQQPDPQIQGRIEAVIRRLLLMESARRLLDWRKSGGNDLLEGWLCMTRVQYPGLDFTPYRNEVNRLVNKTWLEINDRMEAHQKIRVINHVFFVMEGYAPNRQHPQLPGNNFLNFVVDQNRGNALSLGLLYLIVCTKLDMPVSGVLLPGYFLLMYHDGQQEFFIDVYNGGKAFSRNDLQRFLKDANVEDKPAYYKPTSNIYIILSLLQNLAHDYRHAGETAKAEDIDQLLKEIDIHF